MSMIGTFEFNRAADADAELARTFAFRSTSAREMAAGEERSGGFTAASSFAVVDAVSLPGVRMFPSGGIGSS